MKNLSIIFLGTPNFVRPIKDELAKHFTIVNSLNGADLGVVTAYGKILNKIELNTPKYGCINVHPSLLPKYRGPSPIQEAILKGDHTSGITIIKMDEEVDHGPIIYRERMELSNSDNFATLSTKMFLRASEILPKIIEDFIQGKIKPVEQNHKEASFCNLLTRESGYFDINNPPSPEKLDKMIRAYYPWPGVWTRWKGKIVKLLPSRHPERLAKDLSRMRVSNKSSTLRLRPEGLRDSSATPQNDKFLIQMEGKKVISLQDFLNGYPNFPLKEL